MTWIKRYLQKGIFTKFQLIPILRLQVMRDIVHWHCSIDHCVKLIPIDKKLCENCFYFTLKLILLIFFLLGNVFHGGELPIDAKNSNFEVF